MKRLLFIVNPISGGRDKGKFVEYVKYAFDSPDYEYEMKFTEGVHHGYELANSAKDSGDYDMLVAVGGDGSINDVVNAIVGSEIELGIVPMGSGNGLARHMDIPMDYHKSVEIILNGKVNKIDTFSITSEQCKKPILATSLVGVGFDAHVAKKFAESTVRGFQTYAKIVVEDYVSYNPQTYKIFADNVKITTQALFIAVANSDRFGYNAVIAPDASISDGIIDISIVKKIPLYSILHFAYQLFTRSILNSEYVDCVKAKEIKILDNVDEWVNVDGEPYKLGKDLSIIVNPNSLKVIR